MKLYDMNKYKMRQKLEHEIIRAADGELSATEIQELELKLEAYPDLKQDYININELPELSGIYSQSHFESSEVKSGVSQILNRIKSLEQSRNGFADVSVYWFKRYALAASVLFLALTSGFYFSQSNSNDAEFTVEELLYPMDDSDGETYVLYLEQLFEE